MTDSAFPDAISLRPLRVSDAAAMALVLADPSLYEFTGGNPPSVTELERRYAIQTRGRSSDGSEVWLNFVVLDPDGPVGYVQATVPMSGGATEIAWVIGKQWQGRGYATAAVLLLRDQLRERGVIELVAHIHPEHRSSQQIARHLRMRPTGVVDDGEMRWIGRTE